MFQLVRKLPSFRFSIQLGTMRLSSETVCHGRDSCVACCPKLPIGLQMTDWAMPLHSHGKSLPHCKPLRMVGKTVAVVESHTESLSIGFTACLVSHFTCSLKLSATVCRSLARKVLFLPSIQSEAASLTSSHIVNVDPKA